MGSWYRTGVYLDGIEVKIGCSGDWTDVQGLQAMYRNDRNKTLIIKYPVSY